MPWFLEDLDKPLDFVEPRPIRSRCEGFMFATWTEINWEESVAMENIPPSNQVELPQFQVVSAQELHTCTKRMVAKASFVSDLCNNCRPVRNFQLSNLQEMVAMESDEDEKVTLTKKVIVCPHIEQDAVNRSAHSNCGSFIQTNRFAIGGWGFATCLSRFATCLSRFGWVIGWFTGRSEYQDNKECEETKEVIKQLQ